jgi:uncharacterized protein (DUF2267 family)
MKDDSSGDVLEGEPTEIAELAHDVEQHAPLPPNTTGSDAVIAVLCAISQRLDGVADELSELLPPDLGSLVQRCPAHPIDTGTSNLSVTEQVAAHLGMDARAAKRTAAVVLEVILQRLPLDAARRLAELLPEDVRHPSVGA